MNYFRIEVGLFLVCIIAFIFMITMNMLNDNNFVRYFVALAFSLLCFFAGYFLCKKMGENEDLTPSSIFVEDKKIQEKLDEAKSQAAIDIQQQRTQDILDDVTENVVQERYNVDGAEDLVEPVNPELIE